MFEDATFHSRGIQHDQTPKWMLLAMALNLTVFAALMITPLIYPESMTARMLLRVLYAPAPPPPIETRTQPLRSALAQTASLFDPFRAPGRIPTKVSMQAEDGPPPGLVGLNEGIPGSTEVPDALRSHNGPAVVVKPAQPRSITVSTGVAAGMLISGPPPVYPSIAKATRTAGTVVLAATISKAGTIENLHVISGPLQLRSAAVEAVSRWRYHPYLLNGDPVEVDTTVNVVFSLN